MSCLVKIHPLGGETGGDFTRRGPGRCYMERGYMCAAQTTRHHIGVGYRQDQKEYRASHLRQAWLQELIEIVDSQSPTGLHSWFPIGYTSVTFPYFGYVCKAAKVKNPYP